MESFFKISSTSVKSLRTLSHDAFTKQQPASDGEAQQRQQKAAATFHLYEGDTTGRSTASRDPALIRGCSHHLACVDQAVLNTKPHLLAALIAVTFFHFEISTHTNLLLSFFLSLPFFLSSASLLLSQPLALAPRTPSTAPAPPY